MSNSRAYDESRAKARRLLEAHPELQEVLRLWMSDRRTCEVVYPKESALLRRELPEFASGA
jgi:hypothetical protein